MRNIIQSFFGKTEQGEAVSLFTIKNSKNAFVKITNYGATIVSIVVPDKNDNFADVVLGYDDVLSYQKYNSCHGAMVGRHCNRIKDAKFSLNGIEYNLKANDGKNNLHSGGDGFDKKVWDFEIKGDKLVLSYFSEDGESGFPGNLSAEVSYSFSDENELIIEYKAVSDKDTIVNFTNHSYFNLSGHNSGTILNNRLKINADKITEVDDGCVPTGSLISVSGTPFDFKEFHVIGERIDEDNVSLKYGNGYNHHWVISGEGLRFVAELADDAGERAMEVYSDMPGVQVYTANYLDGNDVGKGGARYNKREGICLETQFPPNAINCPDFPSPVLKAGEEFKSTTIYKYKKL